MFKNLIYSAAVVTTLFAQATLAESYVEVQKGHFRGDKVVVVDLGSEKSSSRRDLDKRVYRLEQAVRQLQERVFDLETENGQLKEENDNVKKVTCYIKTNSKGIFSSTQKSMTQAKAEAMQKCSEVIKFGFECDEEKVKCGE